MFRLTRKNSAGTLTALAVAPRRHEPETVMSTTRRHFLRCAAIGAATTAACRSAAPLQSPAVAADPGQNACAEPERESDDAGSEGSLATKQEFPELVGFCDGVPPIAEAEYTERLAAARKQAHDRGYDGVLLEAGVSTLYFTGVRWSQSERPMVLWVPVDGDVVWLPPAFEEGTLRERLPASALVRTWHEHEGPYQHVAALLRESGRRRAKVAVDTAVRSYVLHGLTRASRGTQFDPASGVVEACRMRKSHSELALLRRANEATQAALKAAATRLTEGMTQSEFRGLIDAAQQAAGLRGIWALVLFGPNAAFPHGTAQDRSATPGELILVDTGGSLHGYQSDITRTWAFGSVADELRQAWDTVRAAQDAGLAKMRPGLRCADADAAAREVMAAAGHGSGYERFTHRLGHGIGMQGHEEPYMVRDNDQVLAAGMTMSNEPGIYVPGSFGVRLEDIVAITDDGHEVFGVRPPSLDQPFG